MPGTLRAASLRVLWSRGRPREQVQRPVDVEDVVRRQRQREQERLTRRVAEATAKRGDSVARQL